MSYKNKKITMEDFNKDIYIVMANSLRFPLNEIVAWAIFGDSTFVNDNAMLYSNYADITLDNALIDESHLELMNTIEEDIKQFIDENTDSVDFSTMASTESGMNNILNIFLPAKYEALTLLLSQKDSVFKGFPIWWAAIVIAHREISIFAFKNGSYYLAMQFSEFCKECQARMMFKNVAFIKAYQKKLTKVHKKNGSKGGSQKGVNYSEPKQKALDYHDKYLSDRNEKGKPIHSNDKSAREILSYFERKSVHLGYTERSLSNIISKHRNKQIKV
ncbi:hypothetical protein [Psychrobacter sp. LV10R520-6]|uniref:hypothetical protein n=1 Tax=Psychrobacter sp. LV10R520-6 TaxID=1415574 RepID=UPI0024CBF984|nr:hypothetical protein [Psychrobacter sp. LV10R520-6]SNT69838.1 hypothetical protein SAMN04488491_0948 [Psychrobacter sp. LV10R520-6]